MDRRTGADEHGVPSVADSVTAISALDRQRNARASSQGRDILTGRVALQTLLDLNASGHITTSEHVSRITEPDHVRVVLRDLLSVSRREVLNLVPGPPLPVDVLAAAAPEDLDVMERLPTRSVYSSAIAANEGNRLFLQRYEQAGAQIRVADELPHRLIVCDRVCAVLPLSPTDARAGALVVREPGVVASLYALFSAIWSRATPIARFDAEAAAGLDEDDRKVLLLMSSGVTDEVAAARLGVSVRTYRRTVATLLRRLGASSRFQAGVRAAERGWI